MKNSSQLGVLNCLSIFLAKRLTNASINFRFLLFKVLKSAASRVQFFMRFIRIFMFGILVFNPVSVFAEYWVSIASYKTFLDAEAALNIVNSQSSYQFRALRVDTDKDVLFRVANGPFDSLGDAKNAQAEMEASGIRPSWVWESFFDASSIKTSEAGGGETLFDEELYIEPKEDAVSVYEENQATLSDADWEESPGVLVDDSEDQFVGSTVDDLVDPSDDRGSIEDQSAVVGRGAGESASNAGSSLVLNDSLSTAIQSEDDLLIDGAFINQVGEAGRLRRNSIESAVASRNRSEALREADNAVEPLVRRQRLSVSRSARVEQGERVNIAEAEKFPIDVEFANVPIDVAAQMLSEIIGKNIILGTEVEGNLNLAFYQVPWDVALATILSVTGLAQYEDKNTGIIRWHEPKVLDKWLEAEVRRSEELRRQELANQTAISIETEIFRLFYADPEAVKKQLEEIFAPTSSNGGVLSGPTAGRGSAASTGGVDSARSPVEISANTAHRQLIIRASEKDLDLMAQLIEQIDQPTRQVMIEAFIVEVTDDFERQLGSRLSLDRTDGSGDAAVRLSGTLSGASSESAAGLSLATSTGAIFDLSAPGASTALGILLDGERLKLELSALEQEGYSRTISSPRLLAFDNEVATIFQGIQVPYATVSNEGTQTEFKEAGLKLSVRPSVIGDGRLVLSVTVNQDTVETNRDNPPITSREIKTRLLVEDGGMAVLGGIYLHQEAAFDSRAPVLGKVPLLGRLFKSKQNREDRRELLIFIVPTVI